MDISKLSHGAKLIIGGTVAFLIVSIFNWQEVDISGIASVGRSMWHGWGVLAGLLAIALLVWEVIRLANINVAMPVTPAMTSAALAVLLAIFTVIKFLADNEFRTFWAWLGLILAIAIVVGAWLNMQAAGEGLADIRTQVGSAASAAKGAVDRDDKPASSGRARTGGADAGRAERTALRPAARRRGAEDATPRSTVPGASLPGRPGEKRGYTQRMAEIGTLRVKTGLAEMLKGGVIMDVVDAEQARIAEDAGACAVMALERVPADIRRDGGVARMSDPERIREIQEAVSIPVMAKCRIGHFVEAQILQALEIDYIDESEVLTPADVEHHVDKHAFTVPFVCGATNLGEALRRIAEGAAMIRTKGEAGTGDIVNAVTHMRSVFGAIRALQGLREEELYAAAKEHRAPYELVRWVAENGRLPVVTFTAGGIATPADAALCMQLGADGVFVGSGIFKSGDPDRRAKAIVEATTHYEDAKILADVSAGLGEPMVGISASTLPDAERLEVRGW